MSRAKAPRVLIVEHATLCPAAGIGRWLAEAGCDLRVVRGHEGEELPPTLESIDALAVMGGPMNACDDPRYRWLAPTKDLLAAAIRRDLPTLGICLGHQLLAVAGGGEVQVSANGQQLGLIPVGLSAAGAEDVLLGGIGAGASAVHWNGDLVVTPPPGATILANSAAGIQAFRLGRQVYGVQFHPEVDAETVRGWAQEDVTAGRLTQSVVDLHLEQVAAADSALAETWRGFARRFAQVARKSSDRPDTISGKPPQAWVRDGPGSPAP